jgi:hypothetical protein
MMVEPYDEDYYYVHLLTRPVISRPEIAANQLSFAAILNICLVQRRLQ